VADRTVTWRRYGSREQLTLSVEEFEARLREAIRTRAQRLRVD
jgi:threonyl-tRNA synthetase